MARPATVSTQEVAASQGRHENTNQNSVRRP